ncbi:MAG: IS110 family transposase [Bacteroidetes bacterium]|nr:IS110 family transposase [Bacteroidota bacterium]
MEIKDTIGIDISKLTFDVRIHSNQIFEIFENSNKGFKNMIQWAYRNSSFLRKEIFFVFEHTGLYSEGLSVFLSKQNIPFALVPGLEIKRSLGIARGKDDKIDATKIALYGYRLREEIQPYKISSNQIKTLKSLCSLRDRIVKQRAGYKASLKEQKRVLKKNENKCLFEIQQRMIDYGSKQIERIEKQIRNIVKKDKHLTQTYQLITSIKGVGSQTALFMIIITNGFTKFKNARKFASYCGIAPFPNRSGTSIRGKTKVSHLANKKMKSLLDLCAKVAIQHNSEMKKYYQSRLAIGKNKMSTINIIRNKILARIFAVVDRKTPYVDFMKYAA